MKPSTEPQRKVLVTGAAGFLGKVIVEELLRRRAELGITGIVVPIRAGKGKTGRERFEQDVLSSPSLKGLESAARELVQVIEGDLRAPGCGLSAADRAVADSVTHFIHSAASIEFDLPLKEAAGYNIEGTLELLEIARRAPGLQRFVQISTAYVNPHTGSHHPIPEDLVTLPASAGSIYGRIAAGLADERELLTQTGHPNTYTFTKCLAEHLLVERTRDGSVPLEIVRPSIIGPSWRYPFTGWIDSMAASAGFVALLGTGFMRTMDADLRSHVDVVPVDFVADAAIRAAFQPREEGHTYRVHHAVAGPRHFIALRDAQATVIQFFTRHPVMRKAGVFHSAPGGVRLKFEKIRREKLPLLLGSATALATGQFKQARRAYRMIARLDKTHASFRYFTRHTFRFQRAAPLPDPSFEPIRYFRVLCEGVHDNLLKHEQDGLAIAGRKLTRPTGRLFAAGRKVDPVVHGFSAVLRLASDHCTDRITFDRKTFERAIAAVPQGSLIAILPTHRSYIDPLAWSYLFHNHPELGIPLPKIAAQHEFSKLKFLSSALSHCGAFYIRRGTGKADPALNAELRRISAEGAPIEFFIEGQRSRTGRFLPPRRGLLRALQGQGQPLYVLPMTATYDRVPEQEQLARELRGEGKSRMSVRSLARFGAKLAAGRVNLGRIHLRCGQPLVLGPEDDVGKFGTQVLAALQSTAAVSTFHLESFLAVTGLSSRISLAELRAELTLRGAQVFTSDLHPGTSIDPDEERWMRNQWMHWLLPDALQAHGTHWVVRQHVLRNFYDVAARSTDPTRGVTPLLVQSLLAPVIHDYRACLRELIAARDANGAVPHAASLARAAGVASPAVFHEACETLAVEGVLAADAGSGSGWSWGAQVSRLEELLALASAPLAGKVEVTLEPSVEKKSDVEALSKKPRTRHRSDRLPRPASDRAPLPH